MTQKKLITMLFLCCIFLAGLYLLSFSNGMSRAPEFTAAALLNPNSVGDIGGISISNADGSIDLSFVNDCWLSTVGESVFPADQNFVKQFVDTVTQPRQLYVVSRKNNKTEYAYAIDFLSAEKKLVAELFFGKENYSGKKIYVNIDDSPVYETENVFFPWLSVSPRQWADMFLVPQSLLGETSVEDVQRIVVSTDNKSRIFDSNDSNFYDVAGKFLSLRGGNLSHLPDSLEQEKPLASIRIETGTGGVVTLKIHGGQATENLDSSSFLVVPEVLPGTGKGNPLAAISCDYGLEISAWTYESMIDFLN